MGRPCSSCWVRQTGRPLGSPCQNADHCRHRISGLLHIPDEKNPSKRCMIILVILLNFTSGLTRNLLDHVPAFAHHQSHLVAWDTQGQRAKWACLLTSFHQSVHRFAHDIHRVPQLHQPVVVWGGVDCSLRPRGQILHVVEDPRPLGRGQNQLQLYRHAPMGRGDLHRSPGRDGPLHLHVRPGGRRGTPGEHSAGGGGEGWRGHALPWSRHHHRVALVALVALKLG
mmetsp:Transcript_45735/g.103522  ORF Transcript_45735/g.103522 Transcript_45735/m.103522 type:complete len:226 (+) Transcript_45735:341-1018(+)